MLILFENLKNLLFRPVFLFLINKMEQIGQYDHSNNYSKKKHGQSISGL